MELGTGISDNPLEFDTRYEGVKGSPYVFEKWLPGKIFVNDSTTSAPGLKLNVDGMHNQAAVQLSDGVLGLDNGKIKAVEIETQEGIARFETFREQEVGGRGDGNVLLQVLASHPEYGLYKQNRIMFKKADYQGAYSPDVRYDEYVRMPAYYLRVGDKYEKVKLKKNAIQKIIPKIRRTEGWKGTELTEQKLIVLLAELSHTN